MAPQRGNLLPGLDDRFLRGSPLHRLGHDASGLDSLGPGFDLQLVCVGFGEPLKLA